MPENGEFKEVKKKVKNRSKMNVYELRELHRDKTEKYWKIRNELNEISKLIQKKEVDNATRKHTTR